MSLFDNSPDSTRDSNGFFSACESLERFFKDSVNRDDENPTKNTRSKSVKLRNISPDASSASTRNNSRSSSMDHTEMSRDSPRTTTRSCVSRGRGTLAEPSSDEDLPLSRANPDVRRTRSSGRGRGSRLRKLPNSQRLQKEPNPPSGDKQSNQGKRRYRSRSAASSSTGTQLEILEPPIKKGKVVGGEIVEEEEEDEEEKRGSRPHLLRLTNRVNDSDVARLNSARLMANNAIRLKHKEMPYNFNSMNEEEEEMPAELNLFVEKLKKDYYIFIKRMKSSEYFQRLSQDITTENQRKNQLKVREKQLRAQIEKLVDESIGLLKTRLDELGIEAETPAVFVDKAKIIVNDHYELHKTKKLLEAEIAQHEQTQRQLVNRRERELTEETCRSLGVSHAHARALVRYKLESIMGPLQNLDESAFGNDILITRCSDDKYKTTPAKIRRMRRESAIKQQDWPDKHGRRISNEYSDGSTGPSSVSIEVHKIEAACNFVPIRETQQFSSPPRNTPQTSIMMLPASPSDSPPSRVTLKAAPFAKFPISSPSHSSVSIAHHGPHSTTAEISPSIPKAVATSSRVFLPHSSPPNQAELRISKNSSKVSLSSYDATVNLPKMDINFSMVKAGLGPSRDVQLVLPPHPSSNSNSSDPNDDVTQASQKMTSTPRAEQFEDRLKTIIHSVLSGEGEQDMKPPFHRPPSSSVIHPPEHLPKVIATTSWPKEQEKARSIYPQSNSSRTICDLITSEIEKTLSSNEPPTSSYNNSGPFSGLPGKSQSQNSQTSSMHRMTQIIEDSILGVHPNLAPTRGRHCSTNELEGLACPRTKSPTARSPPRPLPSNRPTSNTSQDYMIEGLAARYMKRSPDINFRQLQGHHETANSQPGGGQPFPHKIQHLENRFSKVQPPTPESQKVGQRYFAAVGARKSYETAYHDDREAFYNPDIGKVEGRMSGEQAAYSESYRMTQQRTQLRCSTNGDFNTQKLPHDFNSRPSKMHDNFENGRNFSSHQPHQNYDQPENLTSSKKIMPNHDGNKKDSTNPALQDEISTGFDRLVAYASEMDKRQLSSGSLPPSDDQPVSYDRKSTLSMKFKGASGSVYQRPVQTSSSYGSSNRAVSSISASLDFEVDDEYDQKTTSRNSLPDHHFKKRYFAETRDLGPEDENPGITRANNPIQMHKRIPGELTLHPVSPQAPEAEVDKDRMRNSPTCASSVPDTSTIVL